MLALDENVRIIALQFSFSNKKHIPESIFKIPHETVLEEKARKKYIPGVAVIEPTDKVMAFDVVFDIENAGYELVDAFYQPRSHRKGEKVFTYHMVRFIFARNEFAEVSNEFLDIRKIIRNNLLKMLSLAIWRVRVFNNPFFENQEEVVGQRAISINFELRNPLFEGDDTSRPIMKWNKDKNGKRIGDTPYPVLPERYLGIGKNNILQIYQDNHIPA